MTDRAAKQLPAQTQLYHSLQRPVAYEGNGFRQEMVAKHLPDSELSKSAPKWGALHSYAGSQQLFI